MKPVQTLAGQGSDILRTLQNYIEQTARVLVSISFGDGTNTSEAKNLDVVFVSGITDVVVGTEKIFNHALGRIPVGYVIFSNDNGGVLYNGTTAWSATQISLKCTVSLTTFKIFIF